MKKKGFTLVEFLIVVVVLSILAAFIIPQFSQNSSKPTGDPAPAAQVGEAPADSATQEVIPQ